MEGIKYILTDETKEIDGHILHRIQAVRAFENVQKGSIGGWIEKEENLSHEGNCWIFGEAMAYNNAMIFENATVHENSRLFGNAKVYGRSRVFGNAKISGNAFIWGEVWIYENACVCGSATISGNASIYENAKVYEQAQIFKNVQVHGNARIHGSANITDDANIYGTADVCKNPLIYGRASIWNGTIESTNQYFVVGPIGSRHDFTTFFSADGKILVSCGCFAGDISEFLCAVIKKHENSKHANQYLAAILSAQMILGETNT